MAPERDKQFRMNLSEDELRMLRELAEEQGLSASDYLRTVIRRQYRKGGDWERLLNESPEDHFDRLAETVERLGGKGPKTERLRAFAKELRRVKGTAPRNKK